MNIFNSSETFSHWAESDINNPDFKFSGLSDKPILYDGHIPIDKDACIGSKKDWNSHNNECPLIYNYSAPTLEVAQRWLREVKNISIETNTRRWVNRYQDGKYTVSYTHELWPIDTSIVPNNEDKFICYTIDCACNIEFQTYEEAQEAGIKKALELILEKGK